MSTNSTDPEPARASVDIVDIVDGVVRPSLPTPDSALVGAHLWRIHWPEIEPTAIRYQEAVTVDHVLSEHRAAVGAEPMEAEASRSGRPEKSRVPVRRYIEGKRDLDIPLVIAAFY